LATPALGKVIGGFSRFNGMVYVRGHANGYDHWAEQAGDGMGLYADVWCPTSNVWKLAHDGGHGGDPSGAGTDGPLHVADGPLWKTLFEGFCRGGQEAGYEANDDYNGEKSKKVWPMEQTVGKAAAGPRPTPICEPRKAG